VIAGRRKLVEPVRKMAIYLGLKAALSAYLM
jgi:hypothetical protein